VKLPAANDECTPEQRRIVDTQLAEGLADVRAGLVPGPFSTHMEFIASLHKEAQELTAREPSARRDESHSEVMRSLSQAATAC